jgi:heme-degrading monooxygenase HmoA
MIARLWRGVAHTVADADAYERHVTRTVFPSLASIPGHRGARVLRRASGDQVEFLVMTTWDSMDAVRKFAGANPDVAVVEPEAQAVLSDYDTFVRHYEITHDSNDRAA